MSDPYIQNLFAERIGGKQYGKGTEIYKFEKIKRAKRATLAAHPGTELIDMGVGEPDEMAFPDCVEALCKAARKSDNRGYSDNGATPFKEAAARWMNDVCGVSGIDPVSQVVHSIGSKAALTILPACFINPGDVALMTTPGAIDVGVELHSMSKAFNMTGWRLGFVVGNPLIVKAYADVKDNSDSGQFLAIQEACAYALGRPEITRKIAAKYSRRMDGLVQ